MEDIIKSSGCTKERALKGKIVPRVAEITGGGMVKAVGQMDVEHCYLDFLRRAGLLGSEEDSVIRYETGYELRRLYYTFKNSATCAIKEPGTFGRVDYVTEEDSPSDIAEERFHKTMGKLPERYKRIVRMICIEDLTPVKGSDEMHKLIIEGLDALYGAMK